MSAVKFKTDKLLPCLCGFKPTHFIVAYGPTPYSIWCPNCKKQTENYKLIGGCEQDIIDLWNNIVRSKSKEELRNLAKQEGNNHI